MNQLTRVHRRLAVFVLLTATAVSPGISSAAAGSTDKLQLLVNDTAAQLQLAYRQHPDERARRQEQLAAAVAVWRAAPRSEANNARLADWLRAAIISSMPGSKDPLPAVPNFAAIVRVEPQPAARTAAESQPAEKKASVNTTAKPEDDPFRDDP